MRHERALANLVVTALMVGAASLIAVSPGVAGGTVPGGTPTVVNTITLGGTPSGISSDGTHVWVASAGPQSTVTEIDAATGTVVGSPIDVPGYAQAISADGTHVWVTNDASPGAVTEIDAATATVVDTIPVGAYPDGISSDGTHVWVANGGDGSVTEIDAATATVVGNPISVGGFPAGISSDGTHVWVANGSGGSVTEIDTADPKQINSTYIGAVMEGMSSDGTEAWVAVSNSNVAWAFRTADDQFVGGPTTGQTPIAVSADGTDAWVANKGDGTVSVISESTNQVVSTVKVGAAPAAVSSANGLVWVANSGDGTVSEIDAARGPATTLHLSPATAGIGPGGTQSYSATGTDGHGVGLGDVTQLDHLHHRALGRWIGLRGFMHPRRLHRHGARDLHGDRHRRRGVRHGHLDGRRRCAHGHLRQPVIGSRLERHTHHHHRDRIHPRRHRGHRPGSSCLQGDPRSHPCRGALLHRDHRHCRRRSDGGPLARVRDDNGGHQRGEQPRPLQLPAHGGHRGPARRPGGRGHDDHHHRVGLHHRHLGLDRPRPRRRTINGAIAATVVSVSPTEITATTGGGAAAGHWGVFVTTNGATERVQLGCQIPLRVRPTPLPE